MRIQVERLFTEVPDDETRDKGLFGAMRFEVPWEHWYSNQELVKYLETIRDLRCLIILIFFI